ncbi:MFS transporter [Paludisphaera rhizosphaerae]|uniref:MFS transporter n=1 Tax=Paludisphaera rhizosphaerae TaxID=2711216 RepID=UPI0013EADF4E|nr:MFS transporter [Paludisphaera rhizosphaerae]
MSMQADPSGTPTMIRRKVLAMTVALGALTYLDRVCLSHAGVTASIKEELGISDKQMGVVFSTFTLAYALFEIPTGAWGDRVGTRRVLTRIVAWWSAFTIATAAAFNLRSLLAVRFLFGAGEAGAFPNVARTLSRWFPTAERGAAQGFFFAGAHLGGGLSPILVSILLGFVPWRWIFVVFGSIGFVWAWAWYSWFRDEPSEHPSVSPEELEYIESGRSPSKPHRLDLAALTTIASNRSLLALCLMYFTQAYGFYFNITWLPTYLARDRGLTPERLGLLAGVLAGLPLIVSAVADVAGGLTSDRLVRARGRWIGRCGLGCASLVVAGLAMMAGATVPDALAAALLITLSGAAASFLLGACWSVCQDVAGPHAALVAACMNTSGQVGAFISPIIFPHFANPAIPLCIAGGLYLLGAASWLLVDPSRPIGDASPAEHL